ncbi:SDR family NAD(P)-dependent oxidoreductase [Kitasatospora griseola]
MAQAQAVLFQGGVEQAAGPPAEPVQQVSGVGLAYATALARAAVVTNDLDADTAERAAATIRDAGGKAVAQAAAVGTAEAAQLPVDRAVEAFGRLDVMVANAGILCDKVLWEMTDDDFDAVVATHLRGTFTCARAAAVRMHEQGDGGRLITIGSPAGQCGTFGQTGYAATAMTGTIPAPPTARPDGDPARPCRRPPSGGLDGRRWRRCGRSSAGVRLRPGGGDEGDQRDREAELEQMADPVDAGGVPDADPAGHRVAQPGAGRAEQHGQPPRDGLRSAQDQLGQHTQHEADQQNPEELEHRIPAFPVGRRPIGGGPRSEPRQCGRTRTVGGRSTRAMVARRVRPGISAKAPVRWFAEAAVRVPAHAAGGR